MNPSTSKSFSAAKAFTRFVLLLNVLAVMGLLIAHFSSYISPSRFWLAELTAISYPIWLIINLCFIVYWLLQFHRFILLSLVALLITYPKPALFFQWNSSTPTSTEKIKLLNYNVRLFDLYNWTGNVKTRAKIFSLLSKADPDIICFQEYYTRDEGDFQNTRDLQKLLKAQSHVVYGISLRKIDHWGLATFSKYPIVQRGTAIFEYGNTNFAIYTDLKINDDTIRVYNAHLQSNHLKEEDTKFLEEPDSLSNDEALKRSESILKRLKKASIKRAAQADELKAHIDSSPYPVILCGDFNDPPFSYTYRVLSKNLLDAFVENGRGFGVTYSGAVPFFRIDYALHSEQLKCKSYKKINTKLSDHYPIVTEFDLE